MKTTHTTLTYTNGDQYIEFTSITGELVSIQGPFVDDCQMPTGEQLLVHTEVNANDEIVHEIYITY